MDKRQAVEFLEYLRQDRNLEGTIYGDALNMAIEALKAQLSQEGTTKDATSELPTIQPERKKGEWIDYTKDGYVECPFCHSATNCDGNKDELHFCFSCGADMRGGQDERG